MSNRAPAKCPYRNGTDGRSLTASDGVGGLTVKAGLTCSRCQKTVVLPVRKDQPSPMIDRKFRAHGWQVDPHLCPDCIRQPKEPPMATKPTAAAMKAEAQMFALLTSHFCSDSGQFEAGWSDARIARETGLAPEHVAEFRSAGFGEIRESAELQKLRADIAALEQMERENSAIFVQQVADLRARLTNIAKGMAR